MPRRTFCRLMAAVLLLAPVVAAAADAGWPALRLAGEPEWSGPMRLLAILTVLSLAPSIVIMLTAFTRIVVVLSMLRQALGMADTPPTPVIVSVALFLTAFTMMPVWDAIHAQAVTPWLERRVGDREAFERALVPVRRFMLAQTGERDLAAIAELGGKPPAASPDQVGTFQLVPAFMLSELRRAFEIGFVVFLPFVLIDLVVAAVLTALGMIMVPPAAFSLPLKILLFVLVDGWSLLAASLVRSFAPM
ncbi:MAG TPA: flagellar type III secretion system pore protein FliP [Candidatus Binatia bacterium]|nr:flagellar type III secretion system pore protein FliP [Candidatus Binatia bacterium]